MSMSKTNLKALDEAGIEAFMDSMGLPGYRARQLMQWIYGRGVVDIGEITVFSRSLREALGEKAYISSLIPIEVQRSGDGTVKLLLGLEDGLRIESVIIPEGDRLTLCVSSQVGCSMGCRFCRTATMGFRRNLEAHEIVDQLLAANAHSGGRRISNIVFMGMGEPLMNIPNVAEAIRRINAFMGLSRRRITVSTSGIPDAMLGLQRVLADKGIYINLALSLNATTDETRSTIMPVNRKYPIAKLMAALRRFPLPKTRNFTIEYVLIEGVNDTRADAARLAGLLKGIPNKVNIIPLNEFEGCGLRRPSDRREEEFQSWLTSEGLTALIRRSKGQDILASCGQLASAGKG